MNKAHEFSARIVVHNRSSAPEAAEYARLVLPATDLAVNVLTPVFSYAVGQRMRFIDFMLAHYAHINRAVLTDFFGISVPQASADFQQYMLAAPNNMVYDKSRKTYVRGPDFQPLF